MICPTGDFTPKCLFRAEKQISISSRKHISSFVANDRLFFSLRLENVCLNGDFMSKCLSQAENGYLVSM